MVLVSAKATLPIPWLIFTKVAPVIFHSKVAEPPLFISVGEALKATISGRVGEVAAGGDDGDGGVFMVIQPASPDNNTIIINIMLTIKLLFIGFSP